MTTSPHETQMMPGTAFDAGPLAIGVDITELDRIQGVLERYGERFLKRIYTDAEIAYSRGRVPQLAGRFAAKEAVMKALGTGRHGVSWREIEVVRPRGRAPTIALHGRAFQRAKHLGIQYLAITISHSRDYAIAQVVGLRSMPSITVQPSVPSREGAGGQVL